jgi:hypothetical protein
VVFVQKRDIQTLDAFKTHHPNIIEGKSFRLNNDPDGINRLLITNRDFLVHEEMDNSGQ